MQTPFYFLWRPPPLMAPAQRQAMDGGAAQNHNVFANRRKVPSDMPTMNSL
jgi:hypothetical protein